MKKLLSILLVLVMCGAMAFAEAPATPDEVNARIAELEALVELYRPFYEAQVIAEYNGGVIFLEDVMADYAYMAQMYAQYGIDVEAYGLAGQVKQDSAKKLLETAVRAMKAAELGLDVLDADAQAYLEEEVSNTIEGYITSLLPNFQGEDVSEEDARQQAADYLDSIGYTHDSMLESFTANYVDEQLYNHITADITVDEDEVAAAYDEMVASAQKRYASDASYASDRNAGAHILWNPEGYRVVKHVLVKFNDEQTAHYSELSSKKATLEAELDAALNPVEAEATDEAEEAAETAEPTATPEPRAEEAIRADIEAVQAELDALYAELMPKAQEVVDKFNAGTAFADLIAEYNEDPGMVNEPTASQGYAISAASTAYDPAFVAGTMSIEAIGGISEPVCGQNGIHIILYESDITPGAVALEEVHDYVLETTLNDKITKTYNAAVAEWVEAAEPVYHFDRLG